MRWQNFARVFLAMIGIACAVSLYVYSRKRPPAIAPPAVLADPTVTAQGAGVLRVRTNVNLGKEELKIEAELETGYADGKTRLQKAHFTSKRSNGTVFEIWAGTAITEGKAVTGDEPGLIQLSGGVRTKSSEGLEVRSDSATYDNIQELATIPGKMTFTSGRLSGEGVGATYDRGRDILWLLDSARVSRAADEHGEGALEATAKGIGLARPDRFMNLRDNARIVQPGQVLTADQLIVHFSDDDRGAKMLEMHGNARVQPGASAAKDAPDMQSDEILLEFHDDGKTLRHATLGGKSRLTQTTDQGRQTITAPEIDIVTAADGRTLTNLQAKGGVTVVLPASGETPDRDIRANSLVASGDEKNGLRAAVFEGGVTFVEKTGGGARGGRGPAPAAVNRTGTSTTLVLDLKGQLGAIQSSEFRQNVVFQDRDMKATAFKAIHNESKGTLDLSPDPNVKSAMTRVDDGTVRVDAASIVVDLTTHDLLAKGGAGAERVSAKMTQGQSGGKTTHTAAVFDPKQPVYGTGVALKYVSSSRAATFSAQPGTAAQVYQEDGNNLIEAFERIEVDQETGNLLAVGQVRTSFLLEAAGATAARRGAPPKAAPPAKAAPAPKAGARPAAPPPVQSPFTVATAAHMTFIDAQRKAVYTGAAAALATLKGPDSDVVARDITLTLASDDRVLKTLEASGQMSAKFEGGREAVGDQLTYDAVTETHVIKGRPMYFKNVQNDASSKKSCTIEQSTELHYQGKDQSINEPGTDTKALRPSQSIACEKPLKEQIR